MLAINAYGIKEMADLCTKNATKASNANLTYFLFFMKLYPQNTIIAVAMVCLKPVSAKKL